MSCWLFHLFLDDGDDVQTKMKNKNRKNSSRPAFTSIRFSRLMHMYVCTHTQTARLVYDDAGFSLEMRNSRTVRTLQSPFFFRGGWCVLSLSAACRCPNLFAVCVWGDVPSSFTPCLSRKKNEPKYGYVGKNWPICITLIHRQVTLGFAHFPHILGS